MCDSADSNFDLLECKTTTMKTFGHVVCEKNKGKVLSGFGKVVDGGMDAQAIGTIKRCTHFDLHISGKEHGGGGGRSVSVGWFESIEGFGHVGFRVGRE